MKAVSRLGRVAVVAAIIAAAAPASGQDAPAATTNAPANETIGPRELQNFSLEGTRTRPAETTPAPAETTPAPTAPVGQAPSPTAAPPRAERAQATGPAATAPSSRSRAGPAAGTPPAAGSAPDLLGASPTIAGTSSVLPTAPASPSPTTAPVIPSDSAVLWWPWLLAALALAGGTAFLLWRRRSTLQFAGDATIDDYATLAPSPAPPPVTAPPEALAPATPPPPAKAGLVSARLRPRIEIGFEPLRLDFDERQVTLHFRIDLFNAGNAPARAVLAEANLFNAAPDQDQHIGSFFAKPIGRGDRIEMIEPLRRVLLTTKISVARDQLQEYEAGGRKVAVPVIAFNALYAWASGEGQTSAAYLLGRPGRGDKMAPFVIESGAFSCAPLEGRVLPIQLRR